MALQTSGLIKLSDVNVELTHTSNTLISIAGTEGRLLSAKPTAQTAVSMSDFYSKSYIFYGTISTNQKELNLATWASANGWPGIFPAVITINSGVYIWSDNTAVAALTTGTFPRGLTIINNGYIMGKGGAGGEGNSGPPSAGFNGGHAVSVSTGVYLIMNMAGTTSYIGGGGGGGGGSSWGGGGGGAGGGKGGNSYYNGGTQVGGAGGAIGASGADGGQVFGSAGRGGSCGGSAGNGANKKATDWCGAGGGGGRIFPGTSTNGAGGDGSGGDGGGAGVAGQDGTSRMGGGGGGWGAAGGTATTNGNQGGAAGNAIKLNSASCSTTGPRALSGIYGAIS